MNAPQRKALIDLYAAYRREGHTDCEAALAVADDVLSIVKVAPAAGLYTVTTIGICEALAAARLTFEASK